MAFVLSGKVSGDKEVARALGLAPGLFHRYLRAWLIDERARLVGGQSSRGQRRSGFRDILAAKRLRRRDGTWSRRIAHLFKGYVNDPGTIQGLYMRAGAGLNRPNRFHHALEMLTTGGTITSENQMPIPMYRNLAAKGITRGFSDGKVFKRLLDDGRLARITRPGFTLYFDASARKRANRYGRRQLLFMGVNSIRLPAMLTGRYDFVRRFEAMQPAMVGRGQSVVDRAVAAVAGGAGKLA